jgi:hypothetical protein
MYRARPVHRGRHRDHGEQIGELKPPAPPDFPDDVLRPLNGAHSGQHRLGRRRADAISCRMPQAKAFQDAGSKTFWSKLRERGQPRVVA